MREPLLYQREHYDTDESYYEALKIRYRYLITEYSERLTYGLCTDLFEEIMCLYMKLLQMEFILEIDLEDPGYEPGDSEEPTDVPSFIFSLQNNLVIEKSLGIVDGDANSEESQNLILYSEQADNAVWDNEYIDVTTDNIAYPSGGYFGDKLTVADTLGFSRLFYINQLFSKAASPLTYTWSCYVKNDEYDYIRFGIYNDERTSAAVVNFWISGGAFATPIEAGGFTADDWGFTDEGDGWRRVWITATTDSSNSIRAEVQLLNNDEDISFVGDGVSGVHVRGIQLNEGVLGTYVETTDTIVVNIAGGIINAINTLPEYIVEDTDIVVFTGELSKASVDYNTLFRYALQTGTGTYGVGATQLALTDLVLLNPLQPQVEANTTNIETNTTNIENNTTIINGLSNTEVDRIIVGGAFIWTEEDLVFQWSFYQYVLLGSVSYIAGNSGSPNLITLDAPDVGEVDDRIDLIAIDGISRDVIVLKGVPSPTPQEPTLVFGVQLRVTAIYVPATGDPQVVDPDGGTIPIATEKVYDENLGDPAEWDVTNLLGTGVVSDDTTVGIPSDLYNIKFPSNLNVNQYEAITLTAGTPVTYDSGGALIFQLKQEERWESSTRLVIKLVDSIATEIDIQLGYTSILPFGFETANDNTWMTVAIPMNSIDASGSALVDVSEITIEAHNHPVLYIDDIRYQTGISTPSGVIVPIRTSDLINDGEDGINPFITDLGIVAIIKLDEGNGIGYVSEGSDRTLFGNIGQNALDLSLSTGVSTTRGATGTHSLALGDDVTASGYGSFACGYNNTASGDLSFIQGYTNSSGGYSDAVYGTFNTSTGPSNVKGYRFIAGLRNTVDVTLGGIALGNGHWVSSFGTTAVGQASLQTFGGPNVDTSPMLVVGNGDFNYNAGSLNVTTRSNAFVVYKSGSVVAPSLTTALIDGEATGKSLITKEWITGQGLTGNFVTIDTPQTILADKTIDTNLWFSTHAYLTTDGNDFVEYVNTGIDKLISLGANSNFKIDLNGTLKLYLNGDTGALQLPEYGGGTLTGTPAYNISVDSSGNIIETEVSATSGGSNIDGGTPTSIYLISQSIDGGTII